MKIKDNEDEFLAKSPKRGATNSHFDFDPSNYKTEKPKCSQRSASLKTQEQLE